jgi:hypothetical protein
LLIPNSIFAIRFIANIDELKIREQRAEGGKDSEDDDSEEEEEVAKKIATATGETPGETPEKTVRATTSSSETLTTLRLSPPLSLLSSPLSHN